MATSRQIDFAVNTGKPPIGQTIDNDLSVYPDATETEWRSAAVGLADYTLNHRLPREELVRALIALGVKPDPAPGVERDSSGKPKTDRRRCGVCGYSQAVAVDGRLYKHPARDGEGDCEGSYGTPERPGVAV